MVLEIDRFALQVQHHLSLVDSLTCSWRSSYLYYAQFIAIGGFKNKGFFKKVGVLEVLITFKGYSILRGCLKSQFCYSYPLEIPPNPAFLTNKFVNG
jgi:hypothetical protein